MEYEGASYTEAERAKMAESQDQNVDLFHSYGFGIKSWLQILWKLILIYSVFSIGAVFVMLKYSEGKELSEFEQTKLVDFKVVAKYSLGNFGAASSHCIIEFLGLLDFHNELSCSLG